VPQASTGFTGSRPYSRRFAQLLLGLGVYLGDGNAQLGGEIDEKTASSAGIEHRR